MKKRITVLITVLVVCILVISGCNSNIQETEKANVTAVPTEKPTEVPEQQTTPEEDKPTSEPEVISEYDQSILDNLLKKANEVQITDTTVTFVDGSGRESVTVDKNPSKVAILYGSYATLWYETGAIAQGIVGGKSSIGLYKRVIGRDITQDEGIEVLAESSAASRWETEKIIAFQPDLIICSTAMNGYSTISEHAEALDIPVIAVDYNNVEDYLKWFKIFSAINGNENMYEEVALKTAEDVAKIVTKVKDLEGPKVISIFHSPKSMSANLSGTLTGAIMKDLGADNFADAWENKESKSRLPFNLEQLVAGNPKHILIQSHTDEEKAKTAIAEQYGEDAVWNSINAVKEGNVHYLQRELFHYRPNNKYSQSYKIVAKILYPDLTFED